MFTNTHFFFFRLSKSLCWLPLDIPPSCEPASSIYWAEKSTQKVGKGRNSSKSQCLYFSPKIYRWFAYMTQMLIGYQLYTSPIFLWIYICYFLIKDYRDVHRDPQQFIFPCSLVVCKRETSQQLAWLINACTLKCQPWKHLLAGSLCSQNPHKSCN